MDIPTLRYKVWRLATRLLLGKQAGTAIGENLHRDLEEDWKRNEVAAHIVERRHLADAYVQTYSFPSDYPPYFPRSFSFPERVAYHLRNVVVAPTSGLYRLSDGRALQQSVGSVPRFYRKGLIDFLRSPKTLSSDRPFVAFSPLDYYHLLFDALPQIVLARQAFPETGILLPSRHPHLMDDMLDLLGIPQEDRLETDAPVLLPNAILVPRLSESGFVPAIDLQELQKAILPGLGTINHSLCQKVYISRSHGANRTIDNEAEIESCLAKKGFRIVHFEEMPFRDQLMTMREAGIVVAPHGAGLANLLAATPGSSVLEIIFPSWFNACYAKLSFQLKLNYRFIRVDDQAGHRLPINAILSLLDEMGDSNR